MILHAYRDVVEPTPCVPGLRVKQVSAGGMHSCVLTDSGEVTFHTQYLQGCGTGHTELSDICTCFRCWSHRLEHALVRHVLDADADLFLVLSAVLGLTFIDMRVLQLVLSL